MITILLIITRSDGGGDYTLRWICYGLTSCEDNGCTSVLMGGATTSCHSWVVTRQGPMTQACMQHHGGSAGSQGCMPQRHPSAHSKGNSYGSQDANTPGQRAGTRRAEDSRPPAAGQPKAPKIHLSWTQTYAYPRPEPSWHPIAARHARGAKYCLFM